MKKNVKNLLFKKRIYINYLNNIIEHSEIEKNVEKEILNSFRITPMSRVYYITNFQDHILTKMYCYVVFYSIVEEEEKYQYLFSKNITYKNNEYGFWDKSVIHFKEEKR